MTVHPAAVLIGKNFGMSQTECEDEITAISKALALTPEMDGLLLGGFNSDIIAIAATAVLRLENVPEPGIDEYLSHDAVRYRAVQVLIAAFKGLV